MIQTTFLLRAATPILLIGAAWACWGQPHASGVNVPPSRYKIVDLVPSLVRTIVDTPGLNDRGDVALWRSDNGRETRSVVLRAGQATEIQGVPGFSLVYPADIDNNATVVGLLQAAQDIRFTRAFRWHEGELDILPPLDGPITSAAAINGQGNIAGAAQVAGGGLHAVLWQSTVARDLGTLANGDYSKARDINNKNIVVGEANIVANGKPHAFFWQDGHMRQLPDIPGGSFCSAQAIDDNGDVTGSCDLPSGISRGVLWQNGKVTDLGALGDEDDSVSTALDINSHTQIVGSSEVADGERRAFLWERGAMYDLNHLIPAGSGWLLLVASRINEAGCIVGRGYYQGAIHFFLLVPQTPPT
jgi:probable HAF family extracellular repeat protein